MEKFATRIMSLFRKHRSEIIFIVSLILISAFLRLNRIDEYMTFLGDEGRDALVVRKMLIDHDFPLLGAPTSIGNMYNGPLYYYMMAFSMAIWWMNPIAAAVMVALIGIAAVCLVYYLARVWFGKVAGVISSTLYAISPINIVYSHSSWNPNPAPFFALLGILGLYKLYKSKNGFWVVLTGASLAFAIQMHLLALILLPIFGVIWLYCLWEKFKRKVGYENFWTGFILAFVFFLILMSPMAIFDFKYNFQNFNAFKTFFFGDRATTINLNPLNTIERIIPIYSNNLINRYIAGQNFWLMILISLLVLLPIVIVVFKFLKRKKFSWPYFTLTVWLVGGVMGLALYKQTIYDHYSSFVNPALFLLFGSIVNLINSIDSKKVNQYIRGVFFLLFLVLVIVNLQKNPLLDPPNRQLQRTQEVSKFIIDESGNKPFNFALIASRNYDAAYLFVLDQYGHKPGQLTIDTTDQLFVVCEDEICNPIGHSKFEISAFGWAKIEWEKVNSGVKVFKLIHNPQENEQSQI